MENSKGPIREGASGCDALHPPVQEAGDGADAVDASVWGEVDENALKTRRS